MCLPYRLAEQNDSGAIREIEPLCVLDFYVHESCQRMGLGKIMFTYMAECEAVEAPDLAYDRPSHKFLAFLAKCVCLGVPVVPAVPAVAWYGCVAASHLSCTAASPLGVCRYYGLKDYVPQNNNFVVYNQYFQRNAASSSRRGGRRSRSRGRNGMNTHPAPTPSAGAAPTVLPRALGGIGTGPLGSSRGGGGGGGGTAPGAGARDPAFPSSSSSSSAAPYARGLPRSREAALAVDAAHSPVPRKASFGRRASQDRAGGGGGGGYGASSGGGGIGGGIGGDGYVPSSYNGGHTRTGRASADLRDVYPYEPSPRHAAPSSAHFEEVVPGLGGATASVHASPTSPARSPQHGTSRRGEGGDPTRRHVRFGGDDGGYDGAAASAATTNGGTSSRRGGLGAMDGGGATTGGGYDYGAPRHSSHHPGSHARSHSSGYHPPRSGVSFEEPVPGLGGTTATVQKTVRSGGGGGGDSGSIGLGGFSSYRRGSKSAEEEALERAVIEAQAQTRCVGMMCGWWLWLCC